MKYTAAEFVALVREMRKAQDYVIANIRYLDIKECFKEVERLEKAVDEAEITDIANLVTDSPLN